MSDYYAMFIDAMGMFVFLGLELSILFLLICAAVSLLQQYIPDSKIQALLGGSHGRGYILAALIGAVTPFCSCSTIPMLRGLLKAKAGFGPTLTFLFASPLLNPIILALFLATFGLKVTVIYTCVALVTSIVAGYILNQMQFEQYVIPEQGLRQAACCGAAPEIKPLQPLQKESSCCADPKTQQVESACCSTDTFEQKTESCACATAKPLQSLSAAQTSCCDDVKQSDASCCAQTNAGNVLPLKQRIRLAFADAWRQFKQVFPYLLFGVSLGAMVYGFVPSDFIAEYASGDSIFAVPIAAIIGIPLYVRVEALIPLSAVLVGKGMGLGAVMALIIGGGGASLTEVILLKSMFRMPMIIAFLVVILGMAVAAGYLFQFVV